MNELESRVAELEQQNRQLREALQSVNDWLSATGTLMLFQIEKIVADALAQTKGEPT